MDTIIITIQRSNGQTWHQAVIFNTGNQIVHASAWLNHADDAEMDALNYCARLRLPDPCFTFEYISTSIDEVQ